VRRHEVDAAINQDRRRVFSSGIPGVFSVQVSERTLIELLRGKGAHADPVACVEDLSFRLCGRTIDGFPHSIWQILNHMNYWLIYELCRIQDKAHAYPEHASGSWLSDPAPASESDWNQNVRCFLDALSELAVLAQSPAEFLSREIPTAHLQQAGQSSTVGTILWQTMAHNSYHIGQIATLRRCLGAWPPRLGGDSW
jgi:uncharacterized damage-inducible protein DinB